MDSSRKRVMAVDDKDRMLSAKEVGRMPGIAERIILAMVARGELDSVQVTDKRIWCFRRKDIDKYQPYRAPEQHTAPVNQSPGPQDIVVFEEAGEPHWHNLVFRASL
jgi:hypothetical protein